MQKEIKLRQITDTSNVCWDISEDQAMALGLKGINALRETFREQDVVRVHPEHMAAFEAWRTARHAAKKEGNANA